MTAPIVPVTGKTPIYGIEYLLEGEPAFYIRARLQRNSEKLEALMAARALAPPAAADLTAVSGRVSTLETVAAERRWRRASIRLAADLPSYTTSQADILVGTGAGAWVVDYDAGPAGSANAMYSTAFPGRLTARKGGEYAARLTIPTLGGTAGVAAVVRLSRNAGGSASPGFAVKSSHYIVTGESYCDVVLPSIVLNAGDYLNGTFWSATTAALTVKALVNGTTARMTLDYLGDAPSTPTS